MSLLKMKTFLNEGRIDTFQRMNSCDWISFLLLWRVIYLDNPPIVEVITVTNLGAACVNAIRSKGVGEDFVLVDPYRIHQVNSSSYIELYEIIT